MTYERVREAAAAQGLLVMGALHPGRLGIRLLDRGTLVLLGAGPDFWPVFSATPEAGDGHANPVDRWSARVIGGLAGDFAATAHYPFGGPPYTPFIEWALKSGRAFSSPTGMLVHDTVGMMISYRGALHFAEEFDIPAAQAVSPCTGCKTKPCTTACPVGALSGQAPYDVAGCHTYLDSRAGVACMMQGCGVRRACPVSFGAGRMPEQSALHMRAFHYHDQNTDPDAPREIELGQP